jgi:DNA-binding response OmpR family regulator
MVTNRQLSQEVYGIDETIMIKLSIRHLRQKIEPDPNNPIYILTIPGVGYQLVTHH